MGKFSRGPACRLVVLGVVLLSGCKGESDVQAPAAPSFPGVSLKIGALDEPAILSGVARERGEWEASRRGQISLVEEPVSPESVATVDVVLFPAQRLGDLVDSGALALVPNAAVMPPKPAGPETEEPPRPEPSASTVAPGDPFVYMDFAPAFRDQVCRYGTDRFALPLGGSALVLVYRRDAFESAKNKAAAREAGLRLEVPATWTQLDGLAKFFQGRDWNADGQPDFGIVAALGDDQEGVGDASFLARAASMGQHRDQYSFLFDAEALAPRIDTPPFVQALEALAAWKAVGPPGMKGFDAAAARAAFRAGNVAMLIDRAERAGTWSHGKALGVAPLPGSERVFEPIRKEWKPSSPFNTPSYLPEGGGWLIGISSRLSGIQLDAALDFARYLASPENLNRMRADPTFPMLPVRASQMGLGLPDPTAAPDVDSRAWADAVGKTLLAAKVVPGLRIYGAGGYLSDLAKGRVAALGGEPAGKALQAVAKAWTDRTAARGRERQLWHYRRSLNAVPTSAQPPEPGK
jgi:multiple sugar transport system substrate-binding protein